MKDNPKIFSKDWNRQVWAVVVQSIKDLFNDNGPQWAAAISYYALLSAFPLLLALASLGSYFVNHDWVIQQSAEVLKGFLPEGAEEIEGIVQEAVRERGGVSIFSMLFLLWGGSRVFGVLTRALNIAYDVDEQYNFIQRTLIEILMLFSIGMLFVAALVSRLVIASLLTNSQFSPQDQNILFRIAIEIIPVGLLFISIFALYRFAPRRSVSWKAALVGTLFLSAAFGVGRPAFWYYVNRYANYEAVYGPIAVMVVVVFWTWLVSLLILFGGELVSHVQDIMIEGKPVEEVELAHIARSPIKAMDGFKDKVKEKINDVAEGVEEAITGNEQETEDTVEPSGKKQPGIRASHKDAETPPGQPASNHLPGQARRTPGLVTAVFSVAAVVLVVLGVRRL